MRIAAGPAMVFLRIAFMAWVCCATAALAQTAPVGTRPAAEVGAGRVVELTIDSASLRGNLLETPSARNVSVYLPPGYDTSSRRYPVLYLLHGIFDSNRTWIGHFECDSKRIRCEAASSKPRAGFETIGYPVPLTRHTTGHSFPGVARCARTPGYHPAPLRGKGAAPLRGGVDRTAETSKAPNSREPLFPAAH